MLQDARGYDSALLGMDVDYFSPFLSVTFFHNKWMSPFSVAMVSDRYVYQEYSGPILTHRVTRLEYSVWWQQTSDRFYNMDQICLNIFFSVINVRLPLYNDYKRLEMCVIYPNPIPTCTKTNSLIQFNWPSSDHKKFHNTTCNLRYENITSPIRDVTRSWRTVCTSTFGTYWVRFIRIVKLTDSILKHLYFWLTLASELHPVDWIFVVDTSICYFQCEINTKNILLHWLSLNRCLGLLRTIELDKCSRVIMTFIKLKITYTAHVQFY